MTMTRWMLILFCCLSVVMRAGIDSAYHSKKYSKYQKDHWWRWDDWIGESEMMTLGCCGSLFILSLSQTVSLNLASQTYHSNYLQGGIFEVSSRVFSEWNALSRMVCIASCLNNEKCHAIHMEKNTHGYTCQLHTVDRMYEETVSYITEPSLDYILLLDGKWYPALRCSSRSHGSVTVTDT